MEVVASRDRRVLAETCGFVRREVGALLFTAGLAALLAWLAAHGIGEQVGVPASVFWVLAGVAAGDAVAAARTVLEAWRDLRWLGRSPSYLAAIAAADAADERVRHELREARRGGLR